MGFGFFNNLNPLRKSCISRISLHARINFQTALGIGALRPHQLDDHSVWNSENPNFKIWKRWHLGHAHHHDHQEGLGSGKEGERVFRLGLAADIGLSAGKALTGYLSGSTAIVADAAHSVSDVVLSGVALLSFKAAMVPKDKEHPYGYF